MNSLLTVFESGGCICPEAFLLYPSLSALDGLQYVLMAGPEGGLRTVKGLPVTFLTPERGCRLEQPDPPRTTHKTANAENVSTDVCE
jgi:hypothetical protein